MPRQRGQRVTTLKTLLGGTAPEMHDVQRAVLAGLSEKLGISYFEGAPTAKEEELARKLYADEIGDDEFVFSIDNPRGAGIYELRAYRTWRYDYGIRTARGRCRSRADSRGPADGRFSCNSAAHNFGSRSEPSGRRRGSCRVGD